LSRVASDTSRSLRGRGGRGRWGSRQTTARAASVSPAFSNENDDTVSESCVLLSDDADGVAQESDSENSVSSSEVSDVAVGEKRKTNGDEVDEIQELKKKTKSGPKKVTLVLLLMIDIHWIKFYFYYFS